MRVGCEILHSQCGRHYHQLQGIRFLQKMSNTVTGTRLSQDKHTHTSAKKLSSFSLVSGSVKTDCMSLHTYVLLSRGTPS